MIVRVLLFQLIALAVFVHIVAAAPPTEQFTLAALSWHVYPCERFV